MLHIVEAAGAAITGKSQLLLLRLVGDLDRKAKDRYLGPGTDWPITQARHGGAVGVDWARVEAEALYARNQLPWLLFNNT